jgi:hypothetical protein
MQAAKLRVQEQVRVFVEDGFAPLAPRQIAVDEQQVGKSPRHELGIDAAAGAQVSLPGRPAHHIDMGGGPRRPDVARQRARQDALEIRDLPRDAAGVHAVGDDQRVSGRFVEPQRPDLGHRGARPDGEAQCHRHEQAERAGTTRHLSHRR